MTSSDCIEPVRDNVYPSRKEYIGHCVIEMELYGNWIQREIQNESTAEMKNMKKELNQKQDGKFVVKTQSVKC